MEEVKAIEQYQCKAEEFQENHAIILGTEQVSLKNGTNGYQSLGITEGISNMEMNRVAYWEGDIIVAVTGQLDKEILATLADSISQTQKQTD